MRLNNGCWNWNLKKVERSINISTCPPRSTPPSSRPIPRALTSISTSSPDTTVINESGLNRNTHQFHDKCPFKVLCGHLANIFLIIRPAYGHSSGWFTSSIRRGEALEDV